MGLLEHIRSKERATRGRYALSFAAGITLCIALIWMSTIPARLNSDTAPQKKAAESFAFDEILGSMQDQMANVIGSVAKEEIETPNLDSISFGEGAAIADDMHEEVPVADVAVPPVSPVAASTSTDSAYIYEKPEPKVILIGTTTARTSSE